MLCVGSQLTVPLSKLLKGSGQSQPGISWGHLDKNRDHQGQMEPNSFIHGQPSPVKRIQVGQSRAKSKSRPKQVDQEPIRASKMSPLTSRCSPPPTQQRLQQNHSVMMDLTVSYSGSEDSWKCFQSAINHLFEFNIHTILKMSLFHSLRMCILW